MAAERISDENMTRHPDFTTEDFLLYASECKRMAGLARPADSRATKMAKTLPKWGDLVGRAATRHSEPEQIHSGLDQPAYS
jgi:hypothetical protein